MPHLLGVFLLLPWLALACGASSEAPAVSSSNEAARVSETPRLSAQKITTAMRGNEAKYRRCFVRQMDRRGYVKTRFAIDALGHVTEAQVENSTLGSPAVSDCLVTQLREQLFGELGAPHRGEWTFFFRLVEPMSDRDRKRLESGEIEVEDTPAIEILPESLGRLSADQIQETVHHNYSILARCYRDSIQRNEQAGGILRLIFTVANDGAVVSLDDAGSQMPDPYAVDCMAESFSAMQFPPPSGGEVRVKYRLELE